MPALVEAVRRAGAEVVEPARADAIVWTSPAEPDRLAAILAPRHRWVALLIAGVEQWLASGVVDGSRTWTCARGVYARGVAEHGVALVLGGARRLPEYARAREWRPLPGRRLVGTTIAVLGAGAIGRELARLLAPLGPRLVGMNRRGTPADGFGETRPARELAAACSEADFLVVAAALTPETERIVDAEAIDALGPEGYLVNVARGRLVDTDALVAALRAGRLGGAALDVTDPEPLPSGHPLWALPNALVTPRTCLRMSVRG